MAALFELSGCAFQQSAHFVQLVLEDILNVLCGHFKFINSITAQSTWFHYKYSTLSLKVYTSFTLCKKYFDRLIQASALAILHKDKLSISDPSSQKGLWKRHEDERDHIDAEQFLTYRKVYFQEYIFDFSPEIICEYISWVWEGGG